ncbi:MAG: ADYC domain-containing protein [Myxococcota bacterium]
MSSNRTIIRLAAHVLLLASLLGACGEQTAPPRHREYIGQTSEASPLAGTELTIRDHHDHELHVRIDAVHPAALRASSPLTMYEVSRLDEDSGRWVPYCQRGPDGLQLAIPLAGRWPGGGARFVEDPEDFTLTCTAGANGKCARMGYLPGMTAHGRSLTPYFEACVRAMRADYCGDGRSFTRAGTPVELRDGVGQQPRWYSEALRFEAAWGPEGALCVRRSRIPDLVSTEALAERCPSLRGAVGETCDEQILASMPGVLLLNHS